MAGMIVPVIPTRMFDFSQMPSMGGFEIVLKSRIDVTEWQTASLIVKVQPGANFSGGFLTIGARLEGPTAEDPTVSFVGSTELASIVVSSAHEPPYTGIAALGVPLGAAFRVFLRANMVAGGQPFFVMLSVDACLRNG